MKRMIVLLAASAVTIAASADITGWIWTGGLISPPMAQGTHPSAAVTLDNDLSLAPSYTGTTIHIDDIGGLLSTADLTVAPIFSGGTYSSAINTGTTAGWAWLVIDPNGGGIQIGDTIGLGASAYLQNLDTNWPPGTPPPLTLGGDVTTNITVIPEPSTFALMGIAGCFVVAARKKKFR